LSHSDDRIDIEVSDELDDIEVLTSYDKLTQPGTLKSEWYNIELQVPTEQSIDVRILPAFELCGQLTSDGSILLPPIVQCKGDIDISEGPLLLSFTSYERESGTRHIWYRSEHSADWQLHESIWRSHDTRNIHVVSAEINHFTEFALGVQPLPNAAYFKAQITNTIHTADGNAPLQLIDKNSPYAQRKFIGNLTDRPMHVAARDKHRLLNERSTTANGAGVSLSLSIFVLVSRFHLASLRQLALALAGCVSVTNRKYRTQSAMRA
jgi:hypothetical protein